MRRDFWEYFFCEGCVYVALAGVYTMLLGNKKFVFFGVNCSLYVSPMELAGVLVERLL